MRILVATAALAGLVGLAGCRCGGDPPRTGSGGAAAATDALWALAPAGARGGLVASPRAVAMAERAVADVRGMLERVPELAPWRRELDLVLQTELGIAGASLGELGLTATKGLALFLVRDGMVAILPVADRARFLARAAGVPGAGGAADRIGDATCREVRGAHYACATSAALLDTLGKGDLGARLAAVGARGDVELVGIELPLGGPEPGQLAAVVQLARGAAVIRGAVRGVAPALADRAAGAHRPRVDAARTAGFAVADVAALAGGADGGGALAGVLRSLRGPLSITVPAGGPVLEAEQALADPAPIGALLERCPELLGPLGIPATLTQGPPMTCRMTLPASSVQLDGWLDGDRLRLGRRDAAPPDAGPKIPLTPIGAELARGAWGVAFWGRGTLLRAAALPATTPAPLEGDAILSIRALALIAELGGAARREPDGALAFVLAVRTAFANPDAIVTKLTAISADEIVSGRAAAAARPIAEAAPGAPFASDFAAGEAGLLIPTAVMNAAVRYGLPALLRRRRP
jgi:hypothetical protein